MNGILNSNGFYQEFKFWYNILLKDENEQPESETYYLGSKRTIENDSSVTFEYKIASTFIKAENPKSILCIPPSDIQEKTIEDDDIKWDFKNISSIISSMHETVNVDSDFFASLLDEMNIDRDFHLKMSANAFKENPENITVEESEELYKDHIKNGINY